MLRAGAVPGPTLTGLSAGPHVLAQRDGREPRGGDTKTPRPDLERHRNRDRPPSAALPVHSPAHAHAGPARVTNARRQPGDSERAGMGRIGRETTLMQSRHNRGQTGARAPWSRARRKACPRPVMEKGTPALTTGGVGQGPSCRSPSSGSPSWRSSPGRQPRHSRPPQRWPTSRRSARWSRCSPSRAVRGRLRLGCGPDDLQRPLRVDIYADGHGLAAQTGSLPRPDVQSAVGAPAAGFVTVLPPQALTTHTICAYGIDLPPGGTNTRWSGPRLRTRWVCRYGAFGLAVRLAPFRT